MTNQIRISMGATPGAGAVVELDGQDISKMIKGIAFEAQVGQVNQAMIMLASPGIVAEIEADVTIMNPSFDFDLLDDLPVSLIASRAEESDWANVQELIANAIQVIKEILNGS